MKTLLILLFFPALCFGSIADSYRPLTEQEYSSFYNDMNGVLNQQRLRLVKVEQQLPGAATRPALRIRYRSLVTELQAKEVIASNFVNNPKLRSPAVRNALLNLLSKSPMTSGDMISFQQFIDDVNHRPPPKGYEKEPLVPTSN